MQRSSLCGFSRLIQTHERRILQKIETQDSEHVADAAIKKMISLIDTDYTMYNMPVMDVCFVELEAFTEEVLRVADEETLRQFEAEIAAKPEAGDLIRHSGGLRKARMKLPGRGKSAGARVIYLWLPVARRFVLFMLYTKAKQADIPPVLLARLRVAVETIKAKYNR